MPYLKECSGLDLGLEKLSSFSSSPGNSVERGQGRAPPLLRQQLSSVPAALGHCPRPVVQSLCLPKKQELQAASQVQPSLEGESDATGYAAAS